MANDAMPQAPAESFEFISAGGVSFTIPVKGQKLILPTKNVDALPFHNEYAVNANRCTIAETPFGGMEGSYSSSFTVGSIYCPTSGCYLQDKNGANTSKYLSAGKLVETSSLTVDVSLKTITEEFIILNSNTSNALPPYSIATCDSVAGWTSSKGTLEVNTTDKQEGTGCVQNTANQTGDVGSVINVSGTWNLSSYHFLTFWCKGVSGKTLKVAMMNGAANIYWTWTANGAWQKLVFPLHKPMGSSGVSDISTFLSAVDYLGVYTAGAVVGDVCKIDNMQADTGCTTIIEINTPDNLEDSSLQIQCWDATLGTPAYATIGAYKLDSSYAAVGTPTSANWKLLDGTKFDDVYTTSPNGRALFPKSYASQTVNGSTGTLQYSSNLGTRNRIGLMVMLPPSDGGRTNFNKIRLKTILYYANKGSTTYEFSNDILQSTGLKNLSNPWICLLDSLGNVGYLVFTERPNSISYIRDDAGNIYELKIDPGNAMVYRGSTYIGNQTTDTDTDGIPDVLEESVTNSVANFLQFNAFNS